jgi:hypothetical protein
MSDGSDEIPPANRGIRVRYIAPAARVVTGAKAEPAPAPHFRLRGRWLDRAGFRIGANVRVLVMPGRLVIELIERDT